MTPREIASRIDAAGTAVEAELGAMSEELASWHPAEGEWCVKEILAHIAQSEKVGFAGRVREILAAEEPPLKATPEVPPACAEDLEQLLARFREQRAASVELVAGLKSADLGRAGIHERVGRLTVNDLIHEWVHHDRTHLKQILSNVQAFVWPEMGGAQAFSE